MQGTIAQIVALVVHGNAYLRSEEQAVAFPSDHSTLTFCELVKFVGLTRSGESWNETPFAQDPVSWLEELRRSEVHAIRMIHMPSGQNLDGATDRMLVGFVGGGGRWLLETTGSNGSDYWEGRWEVGDQGRADRKIWRVTYGRIAANQPPSPPASSDLQSLRQRLTRNLTEISAFAHHQKLEGFAKAFESGLSNLASSSPGTGLYHNDLLTADMPLTAAQLLSAAQSSWVFGGMGSWNDLGFDGDDQRTYEDLSEALYKLLNDSIVSAANSTALLAVARPQPQSKKRSWWRFWA
ncbi:MAG: hypothetical protein M9960_08145 [Xanthomonadaceae bacterium]|nr:hypothetical protein [Xanthomonadaceae bacterium]